MAADCLFCQIAAGEHPAQVVFEDSQTLAFLDHRPVFPGHCLLIPRVHYETLADLPQAEIGGFFTNAQLLSSAVQRALDAQGSFVAINNRVSQSVPHLHTHIVPRRPKDGLRGFFWPRQHYASDAEAEEVGNKLRKALESLKSPTAK